MRWALQSKCPYTDAALGNSASSSTSNHKRKSGKHKRKGGDPPSSKSTHAKASARGSPFKAEGSPSSKSTHAKTWELRSRRMSRRGRIAIAASGTRGLVGEVCLVDCICVGMRGPDGKLIPSDTADGRLNFLGSAANMPKHRVADLGMINYKRVWAWVMEAPLAYDQPRSYMFTGQG